MTQRRPARLEPAPSRVPPQDLDAEKALLGACLLSPAAIAAAREVVKPADFYLPSHAQIFEAICVLDDEGSPADEVTVHAKLVRLGYGDSNRGRCGITRTDLLALRHDAPAVGGASHYAALVADSARKRRLAEAGREITEAALDPTHDAASVLSAAEAALLEAAREESLDAGQADGASLVEEALARAEAARSHAGALSGLPIGYAELDELVGGIEPGNLVVVGARPSMGKTAFLLGGLLANAGRQTPVLVASLEMSRAELGPRLLGMLSGVSAQAQRRGRLTDAQAERLRHAGDELARLPFEVCDRSGATLGELHSSAKAMRARRGLGLVVVDYLQLIEHVGAVERREVTIRQSAEGLKQLARNLGVVVIAAAQLNRGLEARIDKRPLLSDLRESGGIEQAADVVLFLYRDEVYRPDSAAAGTAEVIVAKHRSGPTGTVRLAWLGELARFDDLDWRSSGSSRTEGRS